MTLYPPPHAHPPPFKGPINSLLSSPNLTLVTHRTRRHFGRPLSSSESTPNRLQRHFKSFPFLGKHNFHVHKQAHLEKAPTVPLSQVERFIPKSMDLTQFVFTYFQLRHSHSQLGVDTLGEGGCELLEVRSPQPHNPPLLGSPMSHVDFKKWQCHMSLSFIFSIVTCRI